MVEQSEHTSQRGVSPKVKRNSEARSKISLEVVRLPQRLGVYEKIAEKWPRVGRPREAIFEFPGDGRVFIAQTEVHCKSATDCNVVLSIQGGRPTAQVPPIVPASGRAIAGHRR